MKFLRFLLVLLFLLVISSGAYAETFLPFGVDLNGDGTVDTGYNYEWTENGYGVVDLGSFSDVETAIGSGIFSGTKSGSFYELAAGTIHNGNSMTAMDQSTGVISFYELTYVMEATGTYTTDWSLDGTDVKTENHNFSFDSTSNVSITFYLDELTYPTHEDTAVLGTMNTADDLYAGADNGTEVATFSLSGGNGTLQIYSGQSGNNVDLFALSMTASDNGSIFYFEGDDQSWADYAELADLFIQIYIDTVNTAVLQEEYPDTYNGYVAEFLEAVDIVDGNYTDDEVEGGSGNYVVVSTGGHFYANIVPEPGTMFLLGFGLLGIAGIGRKKAKA